MSGVAEEKVCPDGLLFNAEAGSRVFPCQYPIDVDCTGREETRKQFTIFQPKGKLWWIFQSRLKQQTNVPISSATSGWAIKTTAASSKIAWMAGDLFLIVPKAWPGMGTPTDVIGLIKYPIVTQKVPELKVQNSALSRWFLAYLGFTCPPSARQFGLGPEEYRFFRSPSDCQRYFICIEGRPRLYNCGEGRAFNDLTNACDGAENVTGCAGDLGETPNKLAKFSNQNAYDRFTSF